MFVRNDQPGLLAMCMMLEPYYTYERTGTGEVAMDWGLHSSVAVYWWVTQS